VTGWYPDARDRRLHDCLAEEFQLAVRGVLAITGQENLLNNHKVIQQSIHKRNSDTDIINALQAELLRRWRLNRNDQRLNTLILLSVNALAAAMQSTG